MRKTKAVKDNRSKSRSSYDKLPVEIESIDPDSIDWTATNYGRNAEAIKRVLEMSPGDAICIKNVKKTSKSYIIFRAKQISGGKFPIRSKFEPYKDDVGFGALYVRKDLK